QTNPQLPAFKRFPTLPPLKLLLTDSATYFTKNDIEKKKAVMIMIFSPDCDHCHHETEEMIKRINDFKNIRIVMATTMPFDKMKDYYKKYGLARFKNITLGRDAVFTLPVFYDIRNLPFLAFYNTKGELIDSFEGSLPMEKILAKFKE